VSVASGVWRASVSARSHALGIGLIFLAVAGFNVAADAQVIPQARRIAWQPGVSGGIPARTTICANVKTSYGARGDGVADDTTPIQNAINACPAGQVVYIPAGTYRLNSRLNISKGIVLRGAGSGATFLKTYAAWHGIQVGDFPGTPVATNVSGSPSKDATTLVVASVASPSLAVGDYIVIDQLNDGVEVVNIDSQCRSSNTRCLSQITRITAISGLTLTIDPPLYHAYAAAQVPQVWKVNQGSSMTVGAGIEDLYLERISPTGTEGYSNIKMVACASCWVRNIESKLAQFRHVDLDRSFQCEIRDSFFNDGYNQGIGGFSYGVTAGHNSAANLIENNIFYHLRHSMVVIEGAAGNVFGYNYSVASYQGQNWLAPDMFPHAAHTTMNLYEGNIAAKIHSDFVHGSSSYNTFFRNHVIRDSSALTITNARQAVVIDQQSWYTNLVRNVLGQSGQSWTAYEDSGTRSISGTYVYNWGYLDDGSTTTSSDTKPKTTALRHGNYDYQSLSTKWDPTIPDHTLPDSLYLTSKPGFFGGLPWPPIGPDRSPINGTIPAKEHYEGRGVPPTLPAPANLRIVGSDPPTLAAPSA